jgi:hypothetical protein
MPLFLTAINHQTGTIYVPLEIGSPAAETLYRMMDNLGEVKKGKRLFFGLQVF